MNKPMKYVTESGKEVTLPPTWPRHPAIYLPDAVRYAYEHYGKEQMFNNVFWKEWENMSDEELAKQGIVRDSTRDPPYAQPNIADPFDPDNGWLPIPEAWKKMGLYFTAKAGPAVGRLPPGLFPWGGTPCRLLRSRHNAGPDLCSGRWGGGCRPFLKYFKVYFKDSLK